MHGVGWKGSVRACDVTSCLVPLPIHCLLDKEKLQAMIDGEKTLKHETAEDAAERDESW